MKLHTETSFAKAIQEIFTRISEMIPDEFNKSVHAIVAGGAAVHFYTGARTSHDLDAEFTHRIILPQDLVVIYQDEQDQQEKELVFDVNYTPVLGLIHEDYIQDAVYVYSPGENKKLKIYVLSPVDLAVSKLSRYSDNDKADIEALAKEKLFTAEELKQRAEHALTGYIGATNMVLMNIQDAVKRVGEIQEDLDEGNDSIPR
ncbi:DUF6036 family nucleotidyltransferase (plasmid) [Methylomarinum sp. Ch1-1]|uniref:DUF6036 family nucleotidyltransferase n=1 Tax=Methylomarinum roseum TaxID=3067653 RepID=A0AAU7P1G1_9GAMM|nr:DUF6036 family nucleotidyltransferase [Methylomarinum sp. Ch1-1]MDP4518961.1 DUF6036 family nucleotidyltransferase [Methylomarinum sp. Ch1-1]MDP4523359.1 DUF6036 family nucleotidyltransferase [Methylomarinum sp. Ch1-1]